MRRVARIFIDFPIRLLRECARMAQYQWWNLRVFIVGKAWAIAKIPEQWLARTYLIARQKRAAFVRLPKGFNPVTGRIHP